MNMNVSMQELLQIVGTKEVENALLRKRVSELEEEVRVIHTKLVEIEKQVKNGENT